MGDLAEARARRWLRFYSLLFLASGACFVLGSGLVDLLLTQAARLLPGAVPAPHADLSLWLGLTGSMMAMIALLAHGLARDPAQPLAWRTLLLSKAVSTGLFLAFTALSRNALFLIGTFVDGPILAHLLFLRRRLDLNPWRSRFPAAGPFYEVWFAKFNAPVTRAALWLRYTLSRDGSGVVSGAVWYILTDPALPEPLSGRLDSRDCALGVSDLSVRIAESRLERGHLRGAAGPASWDLGWKDGGVPPLGFVPALAGALGLARTDYRSACALAEFTGTARIAGREYRFKAAPGSVGHLWGRAMADNWRWAHAVLRASDGSLAVFELLSSRLRLGPFRRRLTTAFLWHRHRLHRSAGLLRALGNRLEGGDSWRFRIGFPGLSAEGECAAEPGRRAELVYDSPDGRRILCRNSKTGSLRLTLHDGGRAPEILATADAASVEDAEEHP